MYLAPEKITWLKTLLNSLILLLAWLLTGCFGASRKEAALPMDDIYFEYTINGEEGNDSVSVMIRFKELDEYGPALSIEPGNVLLDGKQLMPDSTEMTGPFYAATRQMQSFTGKHSIEVTLPDEKKFKEEFSFRPFALKPGLKDTIGRNKFQLDFEGLVNGDVLRVMITDTSFTGDGIHRLDTVWHNRVIFTKGDLSYLESGPLNLELTRESIKKIRNGTNAGGTLSVSYSIRRECWLED